MAPAAAAGDEEAGGDEGEVPEEPVAEVAEPTLLVALLKEATMLLMALEAEAVPLLGIAGTPGAGVTEGATGCVLE